MYALHVSNITGTDGYLFPVPLQAIPECAFTPKTEEFEAYNGRTYTFKKGFVPIEFEIETWFPKEQQSFTIPQAMVESDIMTFLRKYIYSDDPVTVLIYEIGGFDYLDIDMQLVGMTTGLNKTGETTLKLHFKEWNDAKDV